MLAHREPEPPLPFDSLDDIAGELSAPGYQWTPEREDALLHLLAQGYTVRRICSQARAGWPTYADYRRKLRSDPDFAARIDGEAAARADSLADMAASVAETSRESTAKADRLRVDTCYRRAAVLDPRRYGAKQQTEISGGLILAAGSLAELAAAAADRATIMLEGDTMCALEGATGPDNVPNSSVSEESRALTPSALVP